MTIWDPAVYERYKAYRDRPALDLMVQIPSGFSPREIWDLGCGTGEHAALLAARHPRAKVHGMDSSEAMLTKARERPGAVHWVQGDIAGFNPPAPPDLIFSNAALHWLPGLDAVIPRLAQTLSPGGVFAVQVPLSHEAAWYDALGQVAADPRWRDRLAKVEGTQPVPPPDRWYELLSPLCGEIDIWTTTYLHVLVGDDPIVDWMSGTGLRPYLQAFGEDEEARAAFLAAYGQAVARDFPRRADGTTLMPFPRLFVVARRAA